MMTVADLLAPDRQWSGITREPEMNPLVEPDAMREAQLLDVRLDALRSTAGLLFELRTALQLRAANTGVLVACGVRELSWSAGRRTTAKTAWTVDGWIPGSAGGRFVLEFGLWPTPGAFVRLESEGAAFFTGNVTGLDFIPDYGEDDEATVRANLANWGSEFHDVSAAFFAPNSPNNPQEST